MPDIFTNKKSETPPKATSIDKKSQNRLGIFSAYCSNPNGVRFANQENDEIIVLFLRRHFITNVPWIFSITMLLIIPPIIFSINSFFEVSFFSIPSSLSLILVLFYYLFVLNYAFLKFINWFYHVGIVTQKRLIDLDVDNILHYHLAETGLLDVVDVSYSQKGFFQSLFKFGDVPIQTEALKANFEFEQTPNPAEVADLITDLRPKERGGNPNA